MALNEKQKAFAEYYAACFNAAEAARKAGYSERTARTIGQQLLTKLDVQDYLRELRATAHNERIATINEVLEYLTDTMRDENEQRKERTKAAQLLREALVAGKAAENGGEVRIVIERQIRDLSLNKEQSDGDNV